MDKVNVFFFKLLKAETQSDRTALLIAVEREQALVHNITLDDIGITFELFIKRGGSFQIRRSFIGKCARYNSAKSQHQRQQKRSCHDEFPAKNGAFRSSAPSDGLLRQK